MSSESITLYHLTSSDKLPSILDKGLVPMNGHHCKMIKDRSSDIVFLCKKEDIKYWMKCFRDVDTLIEIDCTPIRASLRRRNGRCHAPSGGEYGCIESISTDHFSSISKVELDGAD